MTSAGNDGPWESTAPMGERSRGYGGLTACLAPARDRRCCPVDCAGTIPTAFWTITIVSASTDWAVACHLCVRTEWRYETPDGALLHQQHAWNSDAIEEAKDVPFHWLRCEPNQKEPPHGQTRPSRPSADRATCSRASLPSVACRWTAGAGTWTMSSANGGDVG